MIVDRVRRPPVGAGVACLVLLGLMLAALAHVAVQARHFDVALALGQEQALHNELEQERRRLTSEIGTLKNPGEISRRAKETLRMGRVEATDIRVLRAPGAPEPPAAITKKGKRR
jgi:cell division protein FtsL